MGTITKFTDLEVWKESHKLTLLIYHLTGSFPKEELFGLTSQIRRAAVSVESCIAEGFSRFHYKDRLNFYFDARGSIAEIQSQLMIARDVGYLSESVANETIGLSEKCALILGGLIRATQRRTKNS